MCDVPAAVEQLKITSRDGQPMGYCDHLQCIELRLIQLFRPEAAGGVEVLLRKSPGVCALPHRISFTFPHDYAQGLQHIPKALSMSSRFLMFLACATLARP